MAPLDDQGRFDVSSLESGVVVVAATGPLDPRGCELLRDVLLPLAAGDAPLVVLDLTDADDLDDGALDTISRAAALFRRQEGRLLVVRGHDTLADGAA